MEDAEGRPVGQAILAVGSVPPQVVGKDPVSGGLCAVYIQVKWRRCTRANSLTCARRPPHQADGHAVSLAVHRVAVLQGTLDGRVFLR